MKKLLCLLLVAVTLLTLVGCGQKRTVICDGCGAEIQVKAKSNITDEWIVYCEKCETELFGEDGLIS